MDFFANKFARLSSRCFAFPGILARPANSFFLGHLCLLLLVYEAGQDATNREKAVSRLSVAALSIRVIPAFLP